MNITATLSDVFRSAAASVTPATSAAPTIDHEALRLSSRRDARIRLATMQQNRRDAEELRQRVFGCDQQKEIAAAEHVAECGPLQAELAAIEDRSVNRIADRQPADEADEAHRRELIKIIADANERLEIKVAAQDKIKSKLIEQRNRLIADDGETTNLQNALRTGIYANPKWLLRKAALEDAMEWGSARSDKARGKLDAAKAELANLTATYTPALTKANSTINGSVRPAMKGSTAAIESAQNRVAKWSAISDHAGEAAVSVAAEHSALLKQLANE